MPEPTDASAQVNLTEHDVFLSLEMYGVPISVSLWDAGEELAEIDRRHADDPKGSKAFLESVRALLIEKYTLPHCGLNAAWRYYCYVVEQEDTLKKTISTTPGSPTGSASTAEAGPDNSNAPDSPISPDSTPSEI